MAEANSSKNDGNGNKAAKQITKLRDANTKYKSLLKLARERIEKQEEDLEKLENETKRLEEELDQKNASYNDTPLSTGDGGNDNDSDSSSTTLIRVCQRIKVDMDDAMMDENNLLEGDNSRQNNAKDDDQDELRFEIWALLEFEPTVDSDMVSPPPPSAARRWKTWKKFPSESSLSDFIVRDTGEPIVLPPYSLSPEQSARIEKEARQAVSHVTEEFRRYRVRSEVLRKQSDATMRALHSSNVQSTQQKIEGEDLAKDLAQAKSEHEQLVQMKKELKEQDTQWKEAYDILLQENNALKGSGAEALLASQWRHRYEGSVKEKEELSLKIEFVRKQLAEVSVTNKYETKYRDLKESFRLYRKKAKEIFEAQQKGESASAFTLSNDRGTDDAKLAYLRNLMVNYLSTDAAVREHMEGAIGTVLRFTPDDVAKIEKTKGEHNAWF